jgi:hypothetical protein
MWLVNTVASVTAAVLLWRLVEQRHPPGVARWATVLLLTGPYAVFLVANYSESAFLEFVRLARTIQRFQQLIWNTLKHEISNARTEAINTHLRALTKRAYGYHSPEALIAMAMLTRGGLQLELPGRK